jgi:phage-related protein (TIGR01555 family)
VARKRNRRQTSRSPTGAASATSSNSATSATVAQKQRGKIPPGLSQDKAAQALVNRLLTQDVFSNPLARLGYGTPNLSEGTQYPLTRLTNDYQLINSLYRNSWIVRRVVDTIPEDATRNWIQLRTQLPPDQLDRINRVWRIKRFKEKILHGLKWGRLYGGALGLLVIRGHEDLLEEPLDYDTIAPGALENILVVDRWVGAYPSTELEEDPADVEFGLPRYYEVTLTTGQVLRVHHSRVLRFVGRRLPYWEQLAEVYWGESEVEVIYEELKKRDNTSYNIAQLIFLSNLRVIKLADLQQMLSLGDQAALQDMLQVVQAQNWLTSNQGIQLLGSTDEFQTFQFGGFAGLNQIYESFMMDLSGASQIPVTRLFGRSPAGMDATGESDEANYYDTVRQFQDAHLSPVLDKLLPVICVSELGAIPDDLDYVYAPIRTPDDKEIADLVEQKTAAIVNLVNAGIFSQKTALQELRQMADSTGTFGSITQEQIDRADDSTSQGEAIPSDAFAENAFSSAFATPGPTGPEKKD